MIIKVLCVCVCMWVCECVRVLMVIPTASISHQEPFRALTLELLSRGHHVTSVTTDPMYPPRATSHHQYPPHAVPPNFTEIDMHNVSYSLAREMFHRPGILTGSSEDGRRHLAQFLSMRTRLLELHMRDPSVRRMLERSTFDLLVLEAVMRPFILYAHFLKDIPVVLVSSYGAFDCTYQLMGAPTRPALQFPAITRQKTHALSWGETITELWNQYRIERLFSTQLVEDERTMRHLVNEPGISVAALERRVVLLLLNTHRLWDHNRPVPLSVVYVGGMHPRPRGELPPDLKSFLDANVSRGVVYASFGSNVPPALFPAGAAARLAGALRALRGAEGGGGPAVLWRWAGAEAGEAGGGGLRVERWVPQADLLRHPAVRVFITQGGLQSTEEAIAAAVPLVGVPLLADQWFNVERYCELGVGVRLDLQRLDEGSLRRAVETVLRDPSYRENMLRLRALLSDVPEPALQRAADALERAANTPRTSI